jgi:DNA-binding NarL/FixJ family response regulator
VALLAGRSEEAVVWAERAVTRAREVDRFIEYAEGEIVLNRARLEHPGSSGGAAARALRDMVAEAEQGGHRMARRAAARELRVAGLRLPPLAGSGWAGLSAREADVARLVASGASNREVGAALHISDHTVRAHVSRTLAAFGVATRSGLPAAMDQARRVPAKARPALTPRQQDVVALVAAGLPNDEIAVRLGLSQRTVERHVSDALVRWSLTNRTALARTWRDTAS